MRVLVAGAGIGGLAVTLSLEAAGIKAECVDAAIELRPLGLGINLLPHAVRELTELGLANALAASGIPTTELIYHDRFGSRIWAEPRGLPAGYRWPQYSIHRGQLQRIMLDAVRRRMGHSAIRTGMAVEGFELDRTGVRVTMRCRRSGAREVVNTDVLVAADGINSVVRRQLHPTEGPPLWNGIRMWRGIVERAPFLDGRTMIMAGSNLTSKLVAYPISVKAEARGRSLVNWVAEVRNSEPRSILADWRQRGRHEDVLPAFSTWRFDWLDVPALIKSTSEIFEYPMVDRDPLARWGEGAVTLVGDAAHPMYPIGSNGASQAILDARVLAWCLATCGDPSAGIRSYEEARRPPTNELVLANRELGPERVMAMVEQRAPDGFSHIADVLTAEELEEVTTRYRRMAGFAVADLNERPSLTVPTSRARPTTPNPPGTTTQTGDSA